MRLGLLVIYANNVSSNILYDMMPTNTIGMQQFEDARTQSIASLSVLNSPDIILCIHGSAVTSQ